MNDVRFFTLEGKPQGKARVRVLRTGRAYTPEKTKNYERDLRQAYQKNDGDKPPFTGPVNIMIFAFFEPPKSASKKQREEMLLGHICPTLKPDFDNIAKIVCDALNGVAWLDDKQIVRASVYKFYGEEPRVSVQIMEESFISNKPEGE